MKPLGLIRRQPIALRKAFRKAVREKALVCKCHDLDVAKVGRAQEKRQVAKDVQEEGR